MDINGMLEKTTTNWIDHSKQPTRHTEKFSQKSTRSFPDMRFSLEVHRDSVVLYQIIKYTSLIDRFPSKSTKSQKMVILTTGKKY